MLKEGTMNRYKVLITILSVFCSLLPALVNAQWLETTIPVGTDPCALVWNSQNNKVYCANYSSNNVTVIDGQTNSVITTITVGTNPYALVWNSQNNKIYCANFSSNNVTVIGGQTNSVITTITTGSGPNAFCWNSLQNRVYVANYNSSSVSVIRDSIISGIEENHQPLSVNHFLLVVYPNPAKTYFTVRLLQSNDHIKIFNISGKVVMEIAAPMARNDNSVRVSLDGVKNGVYLK
jgi:YVTN family beta-propeller protein